MHKIDRFQGVNGGGSSIGFGATDSPPRFGYVSLHLGREFSSLGETLAH